MAESTHGELEHKQPSPHPSTYPVGSSHLLPIAAAAEYVDELQPVPLELSKMADTLDDLNRALTELEPRLAGILGYDEPYDTKVATADAPYGGGVANQMFAQRQSLTRQVERVLVILRRLEV